MIKILFENPKKIVAAMIALGTLLIILGQVLKMEGRPPGLAEKAESDSNNKTPAGQMLMWLIHEGRLAFRSGDLAGAERFGTLADFFDGDLSVRAASLLNDIYQHRKTFDGGRDGGWVRENESTDASDQKRRVFQDALLFAKNGDINQSKINLEKILETDPSNSEANLLISKIDNYAASKKTDVPDEDSEKLRQIFRNAVKNSGMGNYVEAVRGLEEITGDPEFVRSTPFAASVNEARIEIENELKILLRPKMKRLIAELSSIEKLSAPLAADKISSLMGDSMAELERVAGDPEFARYKQDVDEVIESVAERWLASANTTLAYYGCNVAMPVFQQIKSKLGPLSPTAAQTADNALSECQPLPLQ